MLHGCKINLYGWNLKELKIRFEKEKSKSENCFSAERKNVTLDEWFSEWFEIYKKPYVKDSSVPVIMRKYKNSFGRLLGGRQIKNIINVDVQFTINKLKDEGKGVSTIKDALGLITQCLEMAKQNELISKNPSFEIKVDCSGKILIGGRNVFQ